jgi:DNA-damage-inducible protein D
MAKKSKVPAIQEDGSLINRLLTAFEQARKVDDLGQEYWSAREYGEILGYSWEGFQDVVERGKAALEASDGPEIDHFRHVSKLITAGKGAQRDIGDIELTRRACYLVGINGDPRKKETIAAVQRYFVEQTRKQEITEMLGVAGADRDRLEACQKLEATRQDMRAAVAPRLTRPDDHYEQIKRRGEAALFDKSPDKVKKDFGIPQDREISDFADSVVVKGMDFAAALTARQVREDEAIKGVKKIGDKHAENNSGVRRVMVEGGQEPNSVKPVGDIRDAQARLDKQRTKLLKRNSR